MSAVISAAARTPQQASVSELPPVVVALEATNAADLLKRYRRGVENIDRRTFQLSLEQLNTAFLPDAGVGRWPARVLLGHLADAEIVFVHRMRRIIAEDNPVLALWDEDVFVDSGIYGDLEDHRGLEPEASQARANNVVGGFLATVHTLRQWTVSWLSSLDESKLDRAAMHPQRGPMSLKRILAYDTWHLEHHAQFLSLKLDRMLGPDAAPRGGSCCSGGCACKGNSAR